MNEQLPIVKKESVEMIVSTAPKSYSDNQNSVSRCLSAGQNLLDTIEGNGGLDDELDRQVAVFLEKTRRTVKAMNERRAPVTKLFDQIRKAYTELENSLDPAKAETIPARLQQMRNAYAAKKREEEEARRREELQRVQAVNARREYEAAVEDNYRSQVGGMISDAILRLQQLDSGCTLENYDNVEASLLASTGFSTDAILRLPCTARVPVGYLTIDDCQKIQKNILGAIAEDLSAQSNFEIWSVRDEILDRLPSKKRQLLKAAEASAEEAARIKAEMAAREAEEAMRREEARRLKEQEEKAKKELEASNAEIDGLFAEAAVAPSYSPKTSVKRKITPLAPEAFPLIVSMWWCKEGKNLPLEELSKIFKKQVTFCEKLANDKSAPEEIKSEYLRYDDEVKAK